MKKQFLSVGNDKILKNYALGAALFWTLNGEIYARNLFLSKL